MMETCLGNCVTCLKVNHSLFNDLSENELEILNLDREKNVFKKGETLYDEGDDVSGLICLNHGKVKVVKKGKIEDEFIVSLHRTVDFVGFDDLMSSKKFSSTAIALEDVSICVIRKHQFLKTINANPELALKIIAVQSEKLIDSQNKLLNISQSNLMSRLAFALLDLVDFFGFKEDGVTLAAPIKRRELASMSSMNTANAIRTLSILKKEGLVGIDKKYIKILNKEQLSRLI